jgi:putative PIN family toxin of toxin-antitoxin system
MRIVADTNTIVSGILWQGPPRQVLELGRNQAMTICTSAKLIEELAEVVAREKFARRLLRAGFSVKTLVEDYLAIAELVVVQPLSEPVCRDPDDDEVIACALSAKAECIVTGDDDLLGLAEHRGIAIVTAAKAIERVIGL